MSTNATVLDITYHLGDVVGWDNTDYQRDQYGEIVGITKDGTTLYVGVDGSECTWALWKTAEDGVDELMYDGVCDTSAAIDCLTQQWLAAVSED